MWLWQYNVLQRWMGVNWFEILLKAYCDCGFISLTDESVSQLYWNISPIVVGWWRVSSFSEHCDFYPPASVYSKMLYCIIFVSDHLSVLSGCKWVLIWISFFSFSFLNPNSSSLPCLWCWQCYTTIRQRFVNVFHELPSCMFVCHCPCGTCDYPVDHVIVGVKCTNCLPKTVSIH